MDIIQQMVWPFVQPDCVAPQFIHLQCFGGRDSDVAGWFNCFTNCDFGFMAAVRHFLDVGFQITYNPG